MHQEDLTMEDSYDLERFVRAQADIYDLAVEALWSGGLRAEWVAPIFPPMALAPAWPHEIALGSIDQAEAYLEHPVLGTRYREAVTILETHSDCTALDVFGGVGAETVHSSLTLFALATTEPIVRAMLTVWFGGLRHEKTIQALGDAW
jgi:uncharacterized protein (DUF1810 family)